MRQRVKARVGAAALVMAAGASAQPVIPAGGSDVSSNFPFDTHTITMHQVFNAEAIGAAAATTGPVRIRRIAVRTFHLSSTVWQADLAIRFGYTDVDPSSGELAVPVFGGGGAPNAIGPMRDFYRDQAMSRRVHSSQLYSLAFEGEPFNYDPRLGNLLLEVVCLNSSIRFLVAGASTGGQESHLSAMYELPSGAIFSTVQDLNVPRFAFALEPIVCEADCDESGDLSFFDFLCFQNLFALHQVAADCDRDGLLTFLDFLCFQNAFVAGCP